MKTLSLLIALTLHAQSFALSLNDFQGLWTRFGARCEGDTDIVYLKDPVTLKISGNSFQATSQLSDQGETTASGDFLTAAYPSRADRLSIQLINVAHKDIVSDNVIDQDFLFGKVGLKTLTLRVKPIGDSLILILGGDDPKEIGKGCATATEYLYRLKPADQATNQSAN